MSDTMNGTEIVGQPIGSQVVSGGVALATIETTTAPVIDQLESTARDTTINQIADTAEVVIDRLAKQLESTALAAMTDHTPGAAEVFMGDLANQVDPAVHVATINHTPGAAKVVMDNLANLRNFTALVYMNINTGEIILRPVANQPESIALVATANKSATTFTLFSKLPTELRDKIYDISAEARVVHVTALESRTGIEISGTPRPSIMAASKEAFKLLRAQYTEIFKPVHGQGVMYSETRDGGLQIHLATNRVRPRLILTHWLNDVRDLRLIKDLTVYSKNIEYGVTWLDNHLQDLIGVEKLTILVNVAIGRDFKPGTIDYGFKKEDFVWNSNFNPYYKAADGKADVTGFNALVKVCHAIPRSYGQGVMNMYSMVDRRLEDGSLHLEEIHVSLRLLRVG